MPKYKNSNTGMVIDVMPGTILSNDWKEVELADIPEAEVVDKSAEAAEPAVAAPSADADEASDQPAEAEKETEETAEVDKPAETADAPTDETETIPEGSSDEKSDDKKAKK